MSKPPPSQKHNNTTKKPSPKTAKLPLKPVRTKAAAAKMVPKLPKPKEPKDAQLALTIRLPQTYRDRIDRLAEESGISVNALFQQLFDRYGTKVDLGPRLDGVEERLGQLETLVQAITPIVADVRCSVIGDRKMQTIGQIRTLLDGKPLQAPSLYDADDPAELAFTYVAAYLMYINDTSVDGGSSAESRNALDTAWEALRGQGLLKKNERGASFDVVLTRILAGVLGIENDLQLKQACANVGIDLECGACASIFFTGAAPGLPHECARATTATSAFALPPQVGDTFRDLYISRLDSPTDPVHGFSALVTLRSDAEGATHEVSAFGATFEETHKAIFEELAREI